MSTIDPHYYNPQPSIKKDVPTNQNSKQKQQSTSSAAKQQPTDTYEKFIDPATGKPMEGMVRNGQVWQLPPDTLNRMDMSNTVIEKTEFNGSVKTDSLNAQFKASLKKEALEFNSVSKNVHKLLGFTCEAFMTTLSASGELTAGSALKDGTFFNTSFSAFASAASITHKYTFDKNFASQYDKNPQLTVEYNFASLKSLMESVTIHQNADGKTDYSFEK